MLQPAALDGKLFPAVPVPMAADGKIHADGQGSYVRYMAGQPIGGVAVWAHTGRGLWLSAEQRAEVLQSWRSGLSSDRLILAAAGASPRLRHRDEVIQTAAAMAQQAKDLGADALLVHPPVAFRGHPDQDRLVLEYHSAIAEAGLPLIVFFLYQAAGGIAYSAHVLAQLLARTDVLGIKVATLDSVMTFQQVAALLHRQAPDKLLITGEDRFLSYSLMCGARAALIGMAAACTGLQAEQLQSYVSGDAPAFLARNALIDDLAQHTFLPPMEGYIQRMLWCLVHLDVLPASAAFDPWGPRLGHAEFDQIGECLRRIGQRETGRPVGS